MGTGSDTAAALPGDGALYRQILHRARPYAKYLAALFLLEILDSLTVLLSLAKASAIA